MQKESREREREKRTAGTSNDLKDHLARLGLANAAAYRTWCRKHGFGTGLEKSRKQREKEVAALAAGRTIGSADRRRALHRDVGTTFDGLVAGRIKKRTLTDPFLIRLADLLPSLSNVPAREHARDLLVRLEELGVLLDADPVVESLGRGPGNTMVDGVVALARHAAQWIREPVAFAPATKGRVAAFADLARHLLAEYDVPEVLDAVWFLPPGHSAARQQNWFVHVCRGQNIRSADTTVPLSKRMAHLLPAAPGGLRPTQSLRWAQIRGLGGDNELATQLISTHLGDAEEPQAFWTSVVHFFLNNPMLDYDQIGPIVDYVRHVKFEQAERLLPDGSTTTEPLEPGFSMKGRTAAALLERVEGWHATLARQQSHTSKASAWDPSGIRPLDLTQEIDGAQVRWRTSEILTVKDLVEEGRTMHHCVASYAPYCARGQKSVWSLSAEDVATGSVSRALTIAINNSAKRVVQARGRYNAMPGLHTDGTAAARVLRKQGELLKRGRTAMRIWGDREGLHVPRVT